MCKTCVVCASCSGGILTQSDANAGMDDRSRRPSQHDADEDGRDGREEWLADEEVDDDGDDGRHRPRLALVERVRHAARDEYARHDERDNHDGRHRHVPAPPRHTASTTTRPI